MIMSEEEPIDYSKIESNSVGKSNIERFTDCGFKKIEDKYGNKIPEDQQEFLDDRMNDIDLNWPNN